ncbi:hypothetical protein BJ912DRAFT_158834 [Pholiota molesta]|nr:hypothetical protein BJ912DRAFT_158834 [Pholiota molesta]
MSTLILTAFTYGSNGKRAEIELRPAIPENIRGKVEALKIWSQSLVMSMGNDLKHTDEWTCEICGKPARETKYDVASWTHLQEPRIVIYIHHVCDAGNKTCSTTIDRQSAQMAAMSGLRADFPEFDSDGVEYPLAGSCLNCQKDTSAKSTLSRCGGCKLVRYCGTECQSSDWKRHKKICKMIKSVNWVDGI